MSFAKERSAIAPIFLCWLSYTCAYLGRYSYSSNITAVIDTFGVNHSEAGLVTTLFFFAYGIGQIVNGLLCKRYNKRIMIAVALIISAAANTAIFIGVPFYAFKYLWLLNGAAQSVLWSTLIYVLSKNLKTADLKKAVIIMSTTVPIGTFITYGFSSLMAINGGCKYSFLLGAVAMSAAAVVWFLSYKRVFRGYDAEKDAVAVAVIPKQCKTDFSLLLLIIVLGLLAVANNFVKDGMTTWVPSILKERFGLHESISILLTLTLPVLGLFGATCNTLLEKKIKSFTGLSFIWYSLTAVCIGLVILFGNNGIWQAVIVSFGLISLFMHGVNNLITSMAPLYMRDKINSGMLAGILNGCCYVGSTISSYGLGVVADRFGWNSIFFLLLFVCIFACIISAFIASRRSFLKRT